MKIDKILKSGLLFCLATFVACSSDDDTQPQTAPVFPEKQTLSIPAGETLQVSFNAPQEWRMTSDKAWVRFLAGDLAEEMPIASGAAGNNTVTLLMKTEGHRFEEEIARLDMTMANISQTVFEVTRPAKERVIRLMVSQGNDSAFAESEQLELLYGKTCRVGFEANFDWKIVSTPDWMAPMTHITGEADEASTYTNTDNIITNNAIAETKHPFSQKGEIVVGPHKGTGPEYRFPVVYPGMDDNILALVPDPIGKTFYFSHNGFYGTKNPSNNTIEFTEEKQVVLNVLTKELQRRVLLVQYDLATKTASEVTPEESWLTCWATEGSSEITLSAEPFEAWNDRTLYVYFLPPYYLENDYDFSKDFRVSGQNVIFSGTAYGRTVIQTGKPRLEGFEITTYNSSWQLVTLPDPVKVIDRPDLVEKYGTENIYARAFTKDEWEISQQSFTVKVFGINGPAESNPAQKAEQEKWFKNFGASQNQFTLGGRVKYAELPNGEYPIEILKRDGSVYGVLIISKAE